MKKTLLSALLMMMVALTAMAIPAKRGMSRTLTLANGSTVEATLVGDEFGHYFLGVDGKAYRLNPTTNVYEPASVQAIAQRAQMRRAQANTQRAKRLSPKRVGSFGNYTGKKKGVIILVNFADKEFKGANDNALFQRIANEKNFSHGDFVGSMYDYFYAQSRGQFELTFDVVGPVSVSKNAAYYGSNNSNDEDEHPAEMIIEAVKKADSQVNFADYDWDGDKYVDQVYVVYAGKGEADGGAANTIWPHAYDLRSAQYYGDGTGPVKLDGVTINTYACGGELRGLTGSVAGIGTMCHECRHGLGYPDFYDIDYSGGWGMDIWDLMSGGSYNGDGYVPCGYTAYERWMAGWMEPIELSNTQNVTGMKGLEDGGESYIIYNDGHRDEYFMLENRQQTGWDSELPGSGMLIVHVDYNATIWNNNKPNDDPSHQRMTWIPADNQLQSITTSSGYTYLTDAGLKTDLYPSGNNNVFSNTSTPAAKLYNNNTDGTKYLNKSVEQITRNSDGTISFRFRGVSNTKAPIFSPAPGRYTDAQTVSITSETDGASIYYTIDGTDPTTESTLYLAPIVIETTTTLKAIAVKDGEESDITSGIYRIGASSDKFVKVTSTDQLVAGSEYIFVSPDYNVAAGPKSGSGSYLTSVEATIEGNEATSEEALVFTLGGTTGAYSFQCEDGYLYSSSAKSVTLNSSEKAMWTITVNNDGAVISGSSVGTFQYNSTSPRFTTYTSGQKPAYLYVRDVPTVQTVATPVFSPGEDIYTSPQEVTITCATEGAAIYYTLDETDPTVNSTLYTGPIHISEDTEIRAIAVKEGMNNSAIASAIYLFEEAVNVETPTFNYESGEYAHELTDVQMACATEGATIYYTLDNSTPTTSSTEYTGDITISTTKTIKAVAYVGKSHSEVAEVTLVIAKETGGGTGAQLLYESFSGKKTGGGDESAEAGISNDALDYDGWTSFTKVYLSGSSYANGGCAKLGSSKAAGSMEADNIPLTGDGTLTFYLKKYGSDTGKLNVIVTGATADVTQFTPSDTWTKCTVNLLGGNGDVSIKLVTSSKRAYVDEIILAEVATVTEDPIEQTIGVTGYSTLYYSDKILVVPTGVEATTWHVVDGELTKGRTYKAGQKIPAGEAVVLFDNNPLSQVYEFEVASTCSDDSDPNNMLRGFDESSMTVGETGTSYKFYKFSFKGHDANNAPTNIGFYYGAADGAPFVSAAHKAYLAVPESALTNGAKSVFLFPQADDSEQPTGIEDVEVNGNVNTKQAIYDLQGRRMTNAQALRPGIYIVNGKKVVIK